MQSCGKPSGQEADYRSATLSRSGIGFMLNDRQRAFLGSACLTVCAMLSGCAVVTVATTAVSVAGTAISVGVTAGSVAIDAATTVAKGAAHVGSAAFGDDEVDD
jgi:hypothetical protein